MIHNIECFLGEKVSLLWKTLGKEIPKQFLSIRVSGELTQRNKPWWATVVGSLHHPGCGQNIFVDMAKYICWYGKIYLFLYGKIYWEIWYICPNFKLYVSWPRWIRPGGLKWEAPTIPGYEQEVNWNPCKSQFPFSNRIPNIWNRLVPENMRIIWKNSKIKTGT